MSSIYIRKNEIILKALKPKSGVAQNNVALKDFDTPIQVGDIVHFKKGHQIMSESGTFYVVLEANVLAVETEQ